MFSFLYLDALIIINVYQFTMGQFVVHVPMQFYWQSIIHHQHISLSVLNSKPQ